MLRGYSAVYWRNRRGCSSEPLLGGGLESIGCEVHDEAGRGQWRDSQAHGVALVGHGAGADLVFFEWLFDLLHAGQQPDVVAEFVDTWRPQPANAERI